ncbi:ABC transporter substrate-binding protein [Mesorhizobium argentiipisi]|uniref:ABC transporter substrate-binding protein n=1 Tax=Mesorhizobium argentiipisi TaxID=3015175 RepID=A0ABU8KBJ2_9HYPH
MKRREILKLAKAASVCLGIAVTGGLMSLSPVQAATKTLRILTWEGYADDQWVKGFEQKTGAKVEVTYVGSIDEIFAKLTATKGADYDVVAIETSSYKRLVGEHLVSPIDLSKIPNASNLSPAFKNVSAIVFDGKPYAIPYAWGSIPLIYDKTAYPQAPDSWNVMWDPKNVGAVMTMDEAENNIVVAALVLGFKDPFNLTDEQFAKVKEKLIAEKKNLATLYSGFDDGASIFAQGGVKLMMSQGEPQLILANKKGANAALTIPKEGAIGWIDCWMISAGAQDVDLAYQWIDYMLQKDVGKYLSEKTGYGNTTDEDSNKSIGMTYADRLVWLQAPEDYAKRNDIWNAVKAAPVQ